MIEHPFTWKSAVVSDVGKVRRLNEDAALDRGADGLWAVADGMGGHAAGDLASQLIVNSLRKVEACVALADFVDRVEEAVIKVNDRLYAVANAHNQTSGSTLVALLVRGRHAVTLWAGDSRLYRLRGDVLTRITTDHTQVELYIERGLLDRADAASHPSGNMVTRAVGVNDALRLELDMLELAAGDRYLLCSDGLDKHIDDTELARLLASGEPAAIAQALIDTTLARGAIDNVTVCVVEVLPG